MAGRYRVDLVDEADSDSDDDHDGCAIHTVDVRITLQELAHKMRVHMLRVTTDTGVGYPTSCAAVAEIISTLFVNVMHFSLKNPKHPGNDRLVLSNSHALPMVYAAWAELEMIKKNEIMSTIIADVASPDPLLNFVDVNVGSFQQDEGVGVAVGQAYVRQFIDRSPYWVYCLAVDAVRAHESLWEAVKFAGHYKLRKFIIIFDLQTQSIEAEAAIRTRFDSCGFSTLVADGHDCQGLTMVFLNAVLNDEEFGRPIAIIMRTTGGKHLPNYEDNEDWYGKVFEEEECTALTKYLTALYRPVGELDNYDFTQPKRSECRPLKPLKIAPPSSQYPVGQLISTDKASETCLRKYVAEKPKLTPRNRAILAQSLSTERFMVLCNSDTFGFSANDLKEQYVGSENGANLITFSVGMACRNRAIPYVASSVTFFINNFVQIRMAASSKLDINFIGSHAIGINVHGDASETLLDDLALFQSIKNSTIFYPSDSISCENAIYLAAVTNGICYIRTSPYPLPTIYIKDRDEFKHGEAHVLYQSPDDRVLLIGAGVTLAEAMKAAKQLKESGISVRVLDPFTIKPLDQKAIKNNAAACENRVITIEYHISLNGLGDAVQEVLDNIPGVILKKLTVNERVLNRDDDADILKSSGIDSDSIIAAVKSMLPPK